MSLYKSSQIVVEPNDEDQVFLYENRPELEEVVELHDPEPEEPEFTFKLTPLPGSDAPLEVTEEEAFEEAKSDKKEEKSTGTHDPWDWKKSHGLERLLDWAQERCGQLPAHSGRELGGVQRVRACLGRILSELRRGIQEDFDGKINLDHFEKACKELEDAIDRCQEAEEKMGGKKKKKAEQKDELVKEAGTPRFSGVVVTIPAYLSRIARGLISSTVSSGHDLGREFSEQVKLYNLDLKDQASLLQHLEDCGYPLQQDRLLKPDAEIIVSDSQGELNSKYFA